MFLNLLREVVNYLFYSKRPTEVKDGAISTIFFHKEQKKEREK